MFSVFKQHCMHFYTLFHPYIFLKNTNNVTRITLSNGPLGFQIRGPKYKKKKIQIGIHIVLTNYQPRSIPKSLFLNTLRYNHLSTKTKKYKIILFLKSTNYCKKHLFSQTKTYFCYFNIAFEMSRFWYLVF